MKVELDGPHKHKVSLPVALLFILGLILLPTTIGLAGGHSLSFARWGSLSTDAPPGVLLIDSPKRRSYLVFATAGETIEVRSTARVNQGVAEVTVRSGMFSGDTLDRREYRSVQEEVISVPVAETGFYRVMADYYASFRGHHAMDSSVGSAGAS